jgi:hypothetical protein
MAESYQDQGAIPQGLVEQARARSVDPEKLQFLGKQAAALYTENRTKLSSAVVQVIGREDLGPEHAKRVCEFANQAAYQNEWEKGGSVRNIEFDGGPADPAVVLRELHDGAPSNTSMISDYDAPPESQKTASDRVEEEIFAGFTDSAPHYSEVPSGVSDLHRLHTKIAGAIDHVTSKISGLEVTKESLELELGDAVKVSVLNGESLGKIAGAWSHYAEVDGLKEAIKVAADRLVNEGIAQYDDLVGSFEKTAASRIPNPEHPVISRFIEFQKVAKALDDLRGGLTILEEREKDARRALHSSIKGA